jgi:hypothetical protein
MLSKQVVGPAGKKVTVCESIMMVWCYLTKKPWVFQVNAEISEISGQALGHTRLEEDWRVWSSDMT